MTQQTNNTHVPTSFDIRTVGGVPCALVPDDCTVKDLEQYLEAPVRKKGKTSVQDLKSFLYVFNIHANKNTHIYADNNYCTIKVVFNDNDKLPGHGDHVLTYVIRPSAEYATWNSMDNHKMSQVEFANFIERNLLDITAPAGSDMLLISRTLQAKKNVSFASGINLANGAHQFSYEEDIKGTTIGGKLEIPQEFTIGVNVFFNEQPFEINAKLRYRIDKDQHLIIWYELIRLKDARDAAFNNIKAQIEEATKHQIINADL